MIIKESKTVDSYEAVLKLRDVIRLDTLKMLQHMGYGHIGGSMSIVELLAVLYGKQMRIDNKNPDWGEGRQVFPTGGVRVLAYPAAHHAVADGSGDHAFCYLNLRIGRGRSAEVHRRSGDALVAAAREFFAPVLARRAIGITLQIDEGPEVFDGKFGNLHARFARP